MFGGLHQQQPGGPSSSSAASPGSPPPGGEFVMQMGMQMGQRFIADNRSIVARWLPIAELRKRFHVSHAYVAGKLKMVAAPLLVSFERQQPDYGESTDGAPVEYYPPIDDVCAPDLYIPMMAIITYVTLYAFAVGLSNRPLESQGLAGTVTFALASVILEVFAVNIWRYIVGLPPVSMLDLFAVFGYAYVSISVGLLIGAIGFESGSWLWRFLVVVLAVNFVCFVYKALREMFMKEGTVPKRSLPILYVASAAQVPLFLYAAARPFW